MLKIFTDYEWDDYIKKMDANKRYWFDLSQRYSVLLTPAQVDNRHAQIEHWVITQCSYDVYCMIHAVERNELADKTKKTIRTNIQRTPPTKKPAKYLKLKSVPLEGDELEEYIAAVEEWHLNHIKDTVYGFYFLVEEDALAFKLRWL